MSRVPLSIPPIIAITDPEQGAWAVAAGHDAARIATGRLGADSRVSAEVVELSAGSSAAAWHLADTDAGDGITCTPRTGDVGTGDESLALTTVSGSLKLDGADKLRFEGAGAVHPGWPALQADTVRIVGAWLTPDQALAIVSVRPPRPRGHDKDAISLTAIGEDADMNVFDPRVSSTYGAADRVRRVGIELWLGADQKEDLRSWRIAGEADGAPAQLELDGLSIQAQPLRCHSRGETGIGVYLLVTAR